MLALIDWAVLAQEYGKYGILGVAMLIIGFTNPTLKAKISAILAKVKNVVPSKKEKPVIVNSISSESSKYLNAVDLWYQLREQCVECNLVDAREKLEEVFPLLCQSMTCEAHKPAARSTRSTKKK